MKVTVDTNILVRGVVADHPQQAALAARLLREADIIALPLPVLCEFAWVLRRVYRFTQTEIYLSITALINAANVKCNRPAVEAGLAALKAGGDFADGLIAHEGPWLGSDSFISFDKKAVALLKKQGYPAKTLA